MQRRSRASRIKVSLFEKYPSPSLPEESSPRRTERRDLINARRGFEYETMRPDREENKFRGWIKRLRRA